MSKSHFIRTFHETFGKPPKQYRAEILVAEAKRLLKSGLTVNSVADCFGYDDAFYFSRMFKKYMGVSPAKYRTRERDKI
jgi:AraC-like DNA-binding protein